MTLSDTTTPTLLWFRRDLRLSDHQALHAAIAQGGPVIPVFICDPLVENLGAAPKWRLGLSVESLAKSLESLGSRLILRRGDALNVLHDLAKETGAKSVRWSRAYDPDAIERDKGVKAGLKSAGIEAESHQGHVLFEPWTVETKTGGFYRVYSPFWRSVSLRDVGQPLNAPSRIPTPENWPASDTLSNWALGAAMNRGATVLSAHVCVGEARAQTRLADFVSARVDAYKTERDFPGIEATSRLSENLTYGEISPAQVWHAGLPALERGSRGGEHFLKELVWREFAYHLVFHTPHITHRNWREGWDNFPWETDNPAAVAWQQARTGEPMVDAGMRELYITGTMHNRVRMLVASYLCKHLMTHWKIGMDWFADTLIDWDPASNAMGWQWVAGSGPDAAPYFRIFNPTGQGEKFDSDGTYRKRYLSGFQGSDDATAHSYFDAIPKSWNMSSNDPYPRAVIDLADGRSRALSAYKSYTDAGRALAEQEN